MKVMNKPICEIEGCNNLVSNRGNNRLRRVCNKHHSGGYHPLLTRECSLCGWQGLCDRHRILMGVDGGHYTKGNIIIVCPNCHRLLHQGLLRLK